MTSPRKILVILDDCGPGDAAVITPHLWTLRAAFPDSRIVAVVAEVAAPLFDGTAPFDRLVVSRLYRPSGPRGRRLRKLAELVRLARATGVGYDLAVVLWWGSRMLEVLAFVAAGRGRRVGYSQREPSLMTVRLGGWDNDADPIGQVIQTLAAVGIDSHHLPPAVAVSDGHRAAARRLLEEHGVDVNRMVVVHPGSDWACQQWDSSRWARVADALVERYRAEVVFTGLAAEAGLIDSITTVMAAHAVSLAGKTTIPVLTALLSMARLCVSTDCVTFELSQSVAAPAVVLAGPSKPERVAVAGSPLAVINAQSAQRRADINACKMDHFPYGGCLDYACPMALMRENKVEDVLAAIDGVMAELRIGSTR